MYALWHHRQTARSHCQHKQAITIYFHEPIMSLSTSKSSPSTSQACSDATEYLPDDPPSLAVWLMLRTEQVNRFELPSIHRRCIICEQYMCNYWTEMTGTMVEYCTKKKAQELLKEYEPQPHLRRRLSEGPIEPSANTPQRPALLGSTMHLSPNPNLSNLSAQLVQRHASSRPGQPSVTTKDTPPEFCRWSEDIHTCCSPTGSCNIAVQVQTPGCWHMIGQDCLHRWIISGRNWCRFCGMVWFKEEKSKLRRIAILKECYEGRADHVELWAAKSEREDDREVETRNGGIRRGEWKGILTRELERVILGQCERQKIIDFMREEVLRMDPSFAGIWDELKDRLEKEHCNAITPWKVGYNERDPWTRFPSSSKGKGLEIPARKAPRYL